MTAATRIVFSFENAAASFQVLENQSTENKLNQQLAVNSPHNMPSSSTNCTVFLLECIHRKKRSRRLTIELDVETLSVLLVIQQKQKKES